MIVPTDNTSDVGRSSRSIRESSYAGDGNGVEDRDDVVDGSAPGSIFRARFRPWSAISSSISSRRLIVPAKASLRPLM